LICIRKTAILIHSFCSHLHRAVKVRDALKTWVYIENDKCAPCDRVETIEHCFLEWRRVVRVWDHFSPILSRFSVHPFSVSVPSVFYPLSDFQSLPSSSIYNFLVVTILYWICQTFRNSRLSSQNVIYLVIKDIKLRIRCASIDAVRYFWSLNYVLCSVDTDDNIIFSLN